MEKHYDSDWAKAKSRDLIGIMLDSTVLRYRKPSDCRCLILPGIDAADISQVLEPRHIPMENIIGLEEVKEIVEQLQSKNLGFHVKPMSVEDYVAKEKNICFDFVGLDYTGTFTNSTVRTLEQICKKQTRDSFVLQVANLIKRDRKSVPLYFLGHSMSPFVERPSLGSSSEEYRHCLNKVYNSANTMAKKVKNGESVIEEKKDAYSTMIKTACSGYTTSDATRIFKFVTGDAYEEVKSAYEAELGRLVHTTLKLNDNNLFEGVSYRQLPLVMSSIEHLGYECLKLQCKRLGLIGKNHIMDQGDDAIAFAIYQAIHGAAKEGKSFSPKKVICYSYISESGAPMIGNLYFLSYPKYHHEIAKQIAHEIGFPDRFRVSDERKLLRLTIDLVKQATKFISEDEDKELDKSEANRIFLGNSSKPVLTKQRAIKEFEDGMSIPLVQQKYRGWQNKPLSQWKAHVTMGTYSSKRFVDSSENADLETITKEEAIDLLASGIPADEISSAYATSFSLGQLRAFKMNITKGLYSNGAP